MNLDIRFDFNRRNRIGLVEAIWGEDKNIDQLRRVSKNLGCSIIGDQKYNINSKFNSEKLMLHAFAINFAINSKKYRFTSEIPNYFQTFMKKNNLKFKNNLEKELNNF